jgi:hypothetical protein
MKKRVWSFGITGIVLVIGIMVIGCTSHHGQNVKNNLEEQKNSSPDTIPGSTWTFSVQAGSISYNFAADSSYKTTYSGQLQLAFDRVKTLRALSFGDDDELDGTGSYSVAGQTIIMKPAGGSYLTVTDNGDVVMQSADSFSVMIQNDTFALDAVTFKREK